MTLAGMPEPSARPRPTPRSPLIITAVALRLVAAGGLAKVEGARLLEGMVKLRLGPSIVGTGGAPGPTGRMLWLAEMRLAMPLGAGAWLTCEVAVDRL